MPLLLPNEDENCAANTIANRATTSEKSDKNKGMTTGAQAWFSEFAREISTSLRSLKELMTEDKNKEAGCGDQEDQHTNEEPFFSWSPQKSDENIRRFKDSPVQILHRSLASANRTT